jgi:hypothetical protein
MSVTALMKQSRAPPCAPTPPSAREILEDLEVAGVQQWADSAIILRCRFKVAALEQWAVKREYLRRLKRAFDPRRYRNPLPAHDHPYQSRRSSKANPFTAEQTSENTDGPG